MSIVSSTYVMDGARHVVETHVDHLGNAYTQTFFAPSSWTPAEIQARVDEHGAQIALALAEAEAEQVIG